MSAPALRIAILTHSTNPRGGVVHALALGDALTALGHEVVVHGPDVNQHGFFRATRCGTACVPATPVTRDVTEMVETRVSDYLRYFAQTGTDGFDVWHAQDGISANAEPSITRPSSAVTENRSPRPRTADSDRDRPA